MRLIQSTIRNVRLFVCLSACVCHREKPTSHRTGNFWSKGISLILAFHHNILVFCFVLMIFSVLSFFWFSVLVIQPTVHNGGVGRGRVCGCGCWLSDGWQVAGDRCPVTCDTWHMTCDTGHVTHDMWHVTFLFFAKKGQKVPKRHKNCQKVH